MEETGLELPAVVERILGEVVSTAAAALGDDLVSFVLYGSAAESRLRPTSDVNVILVLRTFDPARIDRLRDPFRTAQAAVRLSPMLLLAGEIPAAVRAFAEKFADVVRRHRVLYGPDPFAGLELSRAAEIERLNQSLLNLALRLRQRYVLQSLREEQAARAVADAAGPLRSAAATILELEGTPAASPKEALHRLVSTVPGDFSSLLETISMAREQRLLPAGSGSETLLRIIDLVTAVRGCAAGLTP